MSIGIGGYALILCVLMGTFGSIAAFSAGEVAGGVVCLLFLLPPAFVLSKSILKSKIASRAIINIPANWPADSYFEGYRVGLSDKGRKLISSEELKFYQKCVAEGVTEINSQAGFAKAKLIYREKGKIVSDDELRRIFIKGADEDYVNKKIYAVENLNVKSEYEARVKDLADYEVSMRFYGLRGKAKREAELNECISNAEKALGEAERKSMSTGALLKKETSWATVGGIASGIAGPIAGAAAAIETEIKNAEVRAYNESMMPAVMMLRGQFGNDASAQRSLIQEYSDKKDRLKNKLVSDDDEQTVFSNLIVTALEHTVKSTGAIEVSAEFSVKEDYRIFETLKPCIDGHIAADIYEDDVKVGCAYFVLPMYGVTSGKTSKKTAYCTKTTGKNNHGKYTIRLRPSGLWAMEQ